MNEQYEIFCLADRTFYDIPAQRNTAATEFAVAGRAVPDGWRHAVTDTWRNYAPGEPDLPEQGWKIHVSACLADADRALDILWDYCVPRDIAFKHLRDRSVQIMLNSKSAFRGSSGKLATVYPADVTQLELVLKELEVLLDGVRGPYILSDLRYAESALYVRYGGFAERYCVDAAGNRVLALRDGTGTLVPDVRGPVFALPGWVELPPFLRSHLDARNAVTLTGLPYEIESVLQFSNGGGVYLGRDRRTGARVVLKEGRPHAGLDLAGRDAVTRIRHEHDVLRRLAGLDVVPAVHDYVEVGGHHFLVQEFVDAVPLQRLLVLRYPLTHAEPGADELREYAEWAGALTDRVVRAVAQLHGRGVVFGDLHPGNILLTDDDRLVLVDFETASLLADDEPATLGHPAFTAPADRRGAQIDRHALACLRLGMFAPQATVLCGLNPDKSAHLARLITDRFPVPAAPLAAAVRTIRGDRAESTCLDDVPLPGRAEWPAVRDAIGRAILASATPQRTDRLFPGDVAQFRPGGGTSLAYGAAGVLYAMAVAGLPRCTAHEDWLYRRALADDAAGIGFYDGLHGVAHVLLELGDPVGAHEVALRCATRGTGDHGLDLHSGLAGVGLGLLHLGTVFGREFETAAARVVDEVADRLGAVHDVGELSGGEHPRAGLLHGSAGPALLFLRAYERWGDPALLAHAATALRQDLRRCVPAGDGTLQVNQGWRMLPYLDEGSVGIAAVLRRYLAHAEDDEFAAALPALLRTGRCDYFVQPGLFTGRTGILAALAGTGEDTGHLVRGLAWHAMPYAGGLAFPGTGLLRLSMDFATGTAGVLFGLTSALSGMPVRLPFLDGPGEWPVEPGSPA